MALLGTQSDGAGNELRLQAVVAGGAPCEFNWLPDDSEALAYFLGGPRRERPDAYRLASPVTFASRDDPPTFFFHGGRDQVVPQSSPEQLARRLQANGVRTEVLVVPSKGHLATFLDGTARQRAIAFLNDVLKRPSAP